MGRKEERKAKQDADIIRAVVATELIKRGFLTAQGPDSLIYLEMAKQIRKGTPKPNEKWMSDRDYTLYFMIHSLADAIENRA